MPTVISVLVSALLMNFNPVTEKELAGIGPVKASQNGRVLGAVEIIKNVPRNVNRNFGFSNHLPNNQNHPSPPKRRKNSESFELSVASGVVIDSDTSVPLWDKGSQDIRPIASISKLMTALVFLDHNPGWDEVYEVKAEDRREGGRIYLNTGEKVKVKDLFYLSLVGSANTATISLVRSTGMNETTFIREMNKKARSLGLEKTNFADPSGLSRFNVSTAMEVAKLAQKSFLNKDIKGATLKSDYSFDTKGGRKVFINSTDKLLNIFPANGISIVGGKTGYTDSAGSCFVGKFINKEGRDVISVVLGSKSVDERFKNTKALVEWIYSSYVW